MVTRTIARPLAACGWGFMSRTGVGAVVMVNLVEWMLYQMENISTGFKLQLQP
jgi:hypothetical protein